MKTPTPNNTIDAQITETENEFRILARDLWRHREYDGEAHAEAVLIVRLRQALTSLERATLEKCLEILADEIATAHTHPAGKTSRLTSAYDRISRLKENI